jgi:hypothetical protein
VRPKRNLTISEAAEVTGISRKAMARRVERGSVRSVLRSGRRLIPRSELVRVGLLPAGGEGGGMLGDSRGGQRLSQQVGDDQSLVALLVRELVDVLQRQAGELAKHRALTVEAESLRLEREVADLRVRLSVLEGGEPQRALERPRSGQEPPNMPVEQVEPPRRDSSDDRLWLPPSAVSTRRGSTVAAVDPSWATRSMAAGKPARRTPLLPLALEIVFIGVVALLAWLADVGPLLAAASVGVAWLAAATFEVARWRRNDR